MGNQQTPLLQAIDALLQALHCAPFYRDYAVRGSYISRQWMHVYPRECKDLDLLYLKDYQPERLVGHVEYLLAHQTQASPSVIFDATAMRHEFIWEDSISPGIRFELPCQIEEGESLILQLDIACNDPMVSEPVEQTINDVTVQSVTLETMAAWKLHGLFEHLNGPWQSKTLWDLYVFCRYNTLNESLFVQATALAFSSRFDPLAVISRLLEGDFGLSKKSRKYWREDFAGFTSAEYVALSDVLDWLRDYLKPLFQHSYHEPLLTQADVIRYRISQLRAVMDEHPVEVRQKLKTLSQKRKILPHKAYNTIHHLPKSRLGTSERCIKTEQYELLTNPDQQKPEHTIIVQEKLDGSCVCAYRKGDELFALGREGDLTDESPNESRRMWAAWVAENASRFMAILSDGERLCGEWLAMAHGTHYQLKHEPFVAFDLFTEANIALNYQEFCERIAPSDFVKPHLIHWGKPCPLDIALDKLGAGHHGAIDMPEGLMWRLERNGRIAFKAKYVRHDKVDGCYLTENTGESEQWNTPHDTWRPT